MISRLDRLQGRDIYENTALAKLNEVIDAVNKQQDIIRQIGEWGSSKGECLWCENLTEVNLDSVNEIMTWRFETDEDSDLVDDTKHREQPADPYAEQRRWEGKLCWVWDEDPEDKIVDVLSCIDTSDKYPYVICDRQIHYKHCEPVKPDDDIIYKGGDNE